MRTIRNILGYAFLTALILPTLRMPDHPQAQMPLQTPLQGQGSGDATRRAPAPGPTTCATEFAMKSAGQTRLAYVVTGNTDIDDIVKSGMQGLTLFLAQRTALEAGEPVGVDPARDELVFFPLIYWPVVPGAPKPSARKRGS